MVTLNNGTSSVEIRSPLLDDEWKIRETGFFRRARGHQLYGYKRTPIQTLSLRFADMNRPKIKELIAFVKASVGTSITLTLDNGDVWQGRIVNDLETAHVGHANNQFTLIFEGT